MGKWLFRCQKSHTYHIRSGKGFPAPQPDNHASEVLGQRRPQRVHGLSVAMAPAAVVQDESAVMATAFVLVYVHRLSPSLVVAAAR